MKSPGHPLGRPELTIAQQSAAGVESDLWVVSGGPGTGKSTTLRARREIFAGALLPYDHLGQWCAERVPLGPPLRVVPDAEFARRLDDLAGEMASGAEGVEIRQHLAIAEDDLPFVIASAAQAHRAGVLASGHDGYSADQRDAALSGLFSALLELRPVLIRARWKRGALSKRDLLCDVLSRATSPEELETHLRDVERALRAARRVGDRNLALRAARVHLVALRLFQGEASDGWRLLARWSQEAAARVSQELAAEGWIDRATVVRRATTLIQEGTWVDHLLIDDAQDLLPHDVVLLEALHAHGVRLSLAGDRSVAKADPLGFRPKPFVGFTRLAQEPLVLRTPLRFRPGLRALVADLSTRLSRPDAVSEGDYRTPSEALLLLVERGEDRGEDGALHPEPFVDVRRREANAVADVLRRWVEAGQSQPGAIALLLRTGRYVSVWEDALASAGLPRGAVQICRLEEAVGRDWHTVALAELDDRFARRTSQAPFDPRSGLFALAEHRQGRGPDRTLVDLIGPAVERMASNAGRRLFRLGLTRARERLVLSCVTRATATPGRAFAVPAEWLRAELGIRTLDEAPAQASLATSTMEIELRRRPRHGDDESVEGMIA